MTNYIFDDFEEVEESIKKLAPKTIYKYREDWNNVYHKELITKQSLWFTAPRNLNDPYDIRTPVRFDFSEINHPIFFQKLQAIHKADNPNVAFTDSDIRVICENKLDQIKQDPKSYFEKNYHDIRNGEIYDRVGLFSCTTDALNETMWAHYGNNNAGFVVGFNTVELARNLQYSIGPVNYSDEVPLYSFIHPKMDADFGTFFLKSKKWHYEQEFRFFTINDDSTFHRAKKYSIDCVTEFLLGISFPVDKKAEFICEVRKLFSKEIPVYQVKTKVSGFGLEKNLIA